MKRQPLFIKHPLVQPDPNTITQSAAEWSITSPGGRAELRALLSLTVRLCWTLFHRSFLAFIRVLEKKQYCSNIYKKVLMEFSRHYWWCLWGQPRWRHQCVWLAMRFRFFCLWPPLFLQDHRPSWRGGDSSRINEQWSDGATAPAAALRGRGTTRRERERHYCQRLCC